MEQLWKLVQAGGTQEPTQTGKPLLVREQLSLGIPEISHRAELVQVKGSGEVTWAELAEKHRAAVVDTHQQRGQGQHRREQQQTRNGEQQVE